MQAAAAWRPFFDWIAEQGGDFTLVQPPLFLPRSGAASVGRGVPQEERAADFVLSDDRPGAPAGNVFWRSNLGEAGWFLHGYESTWLPAALLEPATPAATWSTPCSPARGAGG